MSIPIMGPIAALVVKDCFSNQYSKARYNVLGAAISESIYAALGFVMYFTFFKDPNLLNSFLPILKVIASMVVMNVGKTFIYMDTSTFSSAQLIHKQSNSFQMIEEGFNISIINISLVANHLILLTYIGRYGYVSYSFLNIPFWMLGAFLGMVSWYLIFILLLEIYKNRIQLSSFVTFINYAGFVVLIIGAFTFLNSLWSFI